MGRVFLVSLVLWAASPSVAGPAEPAPKPSPSPDGALPSFNETRTPTSPAFTLLDVAPTAVERPTSPSDVAFSILNKTDNLSSFPRDAALEFSPYWLVSHPRLEWRSDIKRSVIESLARTFTFSTATAQTGTEAAPVTSLAIGGRASLLSGALSLRTQRKFEAMEKELQVEATLFGDLLERRLAPKRAELQALLVKDLAAATSADDRKRAYDHFTVAYEEAKADAKKEVEASDEFKKAKDAAAKSAEKGAESLAGDRDGLLVEIAGGGSWDYPKNSWEDRKLRQWGIWMTPTYVLDNWSAVVVARYLKKGDVAGDSSLDLGARLIYYRQRYAFSAEFLRQSGHGAIASGNRFAGLFEYEVFSGSWATVSIGQGLTPAGAKTVLAQMGLAFNLSQKRYDFGQKP